MSKVGKWESGKVPVLLSHRNENKSPFILHFVRFSLSLTLSKILSLDNKNKKISFCFVLCSFIRISEALPRRYFHSKILKFIWYFTRLFVSLHRTKQ